VEQKAVRADELAEALSVAQAEITQKQIAFSNLQNSVSFIFSMCLVVISLSLRFFATPKTT
jgi:prophage DNA circulation protein